MSYDRAIILKPDYAEAYSNRGNVFLELNRFEEALSSYDNALLHKPDYALAYYNRGNAFLELKRYIDAIQSYDRALTIMPDYAEVYHHRGNAFLELNLYEESFASYDRAIALKPDFADAYKNRGNAFLRVKRYTDAIQSYDSALAFQPGYDFLFGQIFHTRMKICEWRAYDHQVQQLAEKIKRNEKASFPFPVLALVDSLSLQQEAAIIYVQIKYPFSHSLPDIPRYARHKKIRIGYFSADFHDHATIYLMVELFEKHDRSKFESIAFSFGPERQDGMRKRAVPAFDRFIDVRTRSDKEIA